MSACVFSDCLKHDTVAVHCFKAKMIELLKEKNIPVSHISYYSDGCAGQQGGRTWQPFVGSKNGNENFRQARIYNFRVKCVVFARNRKFAKLTQ